MLDDRLRIREHVQPWRRGHAWPAPPTITHPGENMISTPHYLRIVRASAWYDLVSTAGFATPWTFALFLAGIDALSGVLGIAARVPAFAPEHMLMVNLLGSLVIVWAVVRLRDTQVRYGRYDAASRFLFATWQIYALAHGGHPVILGFVVMEIVCGLAQLLPVDDAVAARISPSKT
jgi:hypothetical protein